MGERECGRERVVKRVGDRGWKRVVERESVCVWEREREWERESGRE